MATKDTKQNISEVKAFARGIHISPRKARLVADMIRRSDVEDALSALEFLNKRAAGLLKKLILSGVANASHNFQVSRDRLFIKTLTVDGGPFQLRYKPRAQGRALPIRKQTSHFNLILGVREQKARPPAPAKVKPAETRAVAQESLAAKEQKEPEQKKPRFSFFRRKDRQKGVLKEDVKGKGRINIDRRSGS